MKLYNFNELREKYIAEIEALPYGQGVLVLPNGALQREVKLYHMIPCIGLDTLATKIVNQSREQQGFDLMSRQAQELLVEHLLNEHKKELKYFVPLLGKKGMVKELTGLFTELRRCYLRCPEEKIIPEAKELIRVLGQWAEEGQGNGSALVAAPLEKNHDVALLFTYYISWITNPAHKVYDVEGQYMLAIEMLKSGQCALPYKKIYLSDFTSLNPLEEEFVKLLPLQQEWTWAKNDEKIEENFVLPEGVSTFGESYASHGAEMEGALYSIAAKVKAGAKPEDFLLVVRNLNGFTGVKALAEKLGVPITLPRMGKLSQHPLVSQLLDNLGEGSKYTDFLQNSRNYLTGLHYEEVLSKALREQQITLTTVQNALIVRDKLLDCLNQLEHTLKICSFLSEQFTRETFSEYFRETIRSLNYVTLFGESDGVLLTDAINALGYKRKYLYILGVNDGEWPAPPRENWIYTDLERKSMTHDMGYILPLAWDHYREEDRTFRYLLMTAEQEIHVSWAKDDELDKSVYVEKLEKSGMSELDCRGQRFFDGMEITEKEEVLQQLAQVDTLRMGESVYNGTVHLDLPAEIKLSASKLEKYVECPFSFLAKYLWQQEALEEDANEIKPYDLGSLVHKVIKRFFDENCRTQELKEQKETLRRFFDEGKTELLQNKGNNPLLEKVVEKAWQLLETWWNNERIEQNGYNLQPWQTEWSFDNLEPVKGLPCKVLFKGVVDRVDKIFEGNGYYITDYKTGAAPGINVQLPLYALAWRKEMLKAGNKTEMPIGGSYLSLKNGAVRSGFIPKAKNLGPLLKLYAKDPGEVMEKEEKFLDDYVKGILEPNLQAMLNGKFKTQLSKSCEYCDYKSICRKSIAAGEVQENE